MMPMAHPATCLEDVVKWTLGEGKQLRLRELIPGFCERLIEAGVPILRCSLHIRQLHPQYYTRGFFWNRGEDEATESPREHGIENTPAYLDSPLYQVYVHHEDIRRRLIDPATPRDFPILDDMEQLGVTDYLVKGLPFRQGVGQAITLATDHPRGFSDANLAMLETALPTFAATAELINLERMSRVLLQTYVGRSTGDRVNAGKIRRGDVSRIRAVLLFSDLRGFTQLSEALPGEEVIELLNEYFETLSAPFTAAGGEILKFIGDAMLAIMPVDGDGDGAARETCEIALTAANEAVAALARLNDGRMQAGKPAFSAGLALHVGDVLYGNIGTPDRLDFTVIGHAVNLVSRIEHFCAEGGHPLVLSADFARAVSAPARSLGRHDLKGIAEPQEIFAPA
ncbi:MAG: adenylate/guanylate cyclase domain-containing protein [Pseudomonadota bacterium]